MSLSLVKAVVGSPMASGCLYKSLCQFEEGCSLIAAGESALEKANPAMMGLVSSGPDGVEGKRMCSERMSLCSQFAAWNQRRLCTSFRAREMRVVMLGVREKMFRREESWGGGREGD